MLKKIIILPLFLYSVLAAEFVTNVNESTQKISDFTMISDDLETGLIVDHLAVDAMIAAWGFKYWAWGKHSEHVRAEDWFEQDGDTGGSDKVGHAYMTYLLSRVLSSRMEDRGMSLQESSLYGSLSGMLAMTLLEVGDGTSAYGFSNEDLIMDAAGAVLAYFIRAYPAVDDFIDIRLEYLPTSEYLKEGDAATDYSGMKHLVAFKLSGFESLKNTGWGIVELQTGYYARGYRSFDPVGTQSQHMYAGIGLNLSDLARRSGINVLENIFEFYQPGKTYKEYSIWER